jgi:glucose-6-phosphate isomerase
LTISLAIGFDNFDELLGGADEMDDHLKRQILIRICRLFLLLSIWYNNFFGRRALILIRNIFKTGSLFTARNNGE